MDGFAKGELSPEEEELVKQWYNSFSESEENVPGLEHPQAIATLRMEMDKAIRKRLSEPRTTWRRAVSIAAAAVILCTTGTVFYLRQQPQVPTDYESHSITYREITTGIRQVKKLTLPDSSVIHLNANSRLQITEPFSKREVILEEGEAYFQVAPDATRPFRVKTPRMAVDVLGTVFNVRSYRALENSIVSVDEGKVRISNDTGVLAELIANQALDFHLSTGQTAVLPFEAGSVSGWMTGVIALKKAPFNELAQHLYNLYGVRLNSKHAVTVQHRYHLNLRADRSLAETMDVICGIHHTTYRRNGNDITIIP